MRRPALARFAPARPFPARMVPTVRTGFALAALGLLAGPSAAAARTAPPIIASSAAADRVLGSGPTARALLVESEYDAVRVPDAAGLNPRQQITLEAWIKRRPAGVCGTVVGKGRATGYWLGVCNGRLRFSAGGPGAEGTVVLPEGRWTHVAAAFDGVTLSLFVDGKLDRAVALPQDDLAVTTTPLSIGADVAPGTYFPGWIDHVRLWSVARTEVPIRADRLATLSARAGLVAQWPLDGDARDLVGGHDGEGGTGFTFDGALPRDVTLPLSEAPIAVDGACDPAEYGTAERLALEGPDAVSAYVLVTAAAVHVCVPDMARPPVANAFVAVQLDRNQSRDARTQLGDYRILVRQAGTNGAEEGDGQGGWKTVTLSAGTWEAARVTGTDRWSAEIKVSRTLLEPPRDPDDPYSLGLALVYSGARAVGDDRAWPPGAAAGAPATWAAATLAEAAGLLPRFTFTGTVLKPGADAGLTGSGGASVQLLTADGDSRMQVVRLVDSAVTDGSGAFRLSFVGYAPERFLVREVDPRGAASVGADAGPRGRSAGANVLVYDIDAAAPASAGVFGGARFIDGVTPIMPPPQQRHYLILYGPPVSEADLAPFVRAKRAQGFRVLTRSTLDIARGGSGRDLAEKIHRWLESAWLQAAGDVAEPAPVYALLIGRGDVVPVRDIGWSGNDHRDPAHGDYYPAWPTDMYYADLDSDWDADGDGYFGEFLRCRPGDTYPDGDEDRDCPEAGSLAREGPYGALRGTTDDFRAEIAVGRLPINEPGEVRRALATILAAQMGGSAKARILAAGAFWDYEGDSYAAERRGAVPGGDPLADAWLRAPWDGAAPYGHDAGEAIENSVLPRLAGLAPDARRLYESTAPNGDASLSPTGLIPDGPLTPNDFALAWQRGNGLVLAAGRGGADGVYGGRWATDLDGDRRIDQPADPARCPGAAPAAACRELTIERFLDGTSAGGGMPPVLIANAGGTGAVAWDWDGADSLGNIIGLRDGPEALPSWLLGRGAAAAFVGSYAPIEPGALDGFTAQLAEQLMAHGLPLGDAFALAAGELARRFPYDVRAYGAALFGDPSFAYWGGVPDALGPWPADGGGDRASGASPASGPIVPERAWVIRDANPGTPVVIGHQGEPVALGGVGAVRYTPSGAVAGQSNVGAAAAAARYAPALTIDGVVAAAGTSVLVLDTDLKLRREVRLPAGAVVSGAARVAADGRAWIPTSAGLFGLDGAGQLDAVSNEPVHGATAFLPTGEVVWSTDDGRVFGHLRAPSGEAVTRELTSRALGAITAPAVSAEGTVFVGTGAGRVSAFPPEQRPGWQIDAGAAVRARPAVAADGALVVGNARGEVMAFAAERTERLWTTALGAAIEASPAVDGSQAYVVAGQTLHALDLATGAVLWTVPLEGTTDDRSAPVIGADRTVYVTRSDRAVVAVRESGWLAAPSDVRIEVAAGVMTVRWRDNTADEAGFGIELCDAEGLCAAAGTAAANATRFEVRRPAADAGLMVTARVQALGRLDGGPALTGRVDTAGPGDGSAPLAPADTADATAASELAASNAAVIPPGRPTAPTAVTASATDPAALKVSWQYEADSGALTGFAVRRRAADDDPWQTVAVQSVDARVFVDRGLAPNTTYAYQVVAESDGGTSTSSEAEGTTWHEDLAAPRGLQAGGRRDGLLLQWQDVNGTDTGVLIERLDPGMAVFRVVGRLGANARQFVDRYELLPGTYSYRVRALGLQTASPASGLTVQFGQSRPGTLYVPLVQTYRRR